MSLPPHAGLNFTKTIHNDIYPAIDPTKSDLSQPGKVVLITGAGRGVGRSMALQYAASGVASIIICARTASELDAVAEEIKHIKSSVRVHKHTVDVADQKSVVSLAKAVRDEEGRLDVLVNNAGFSAPWVPIVVSEADSYLQTFNVNVGGTSLMLIYFLPLIIETAKKENVPVDIINVTSIGGNLVLPGASAYQTSKAAVSRLSEAVAVEYGNDGVNCFALHPGAVLTKLSGAEEVIRDYLIDTADLSGGFVVWLTKKGKSWLSGRYVSATWDVTELEAMEKEIVQGDKLKQRLIV